MATKRPALPGIVLAAAVFGRPLCARPVPSASTPDATAVTTAIVADASVASDAAASATAGPSAAAIERSRQWLADLRWVIAHKATVNPARAGEGDAASRCDAVAAAIGELGSAADAGTGGRTRTEGEATYRKNLEDAGELCAFDVPLVTASEALDRLSFSPSQASRLLQCNVARREVDKARAIHPRDARLRQVDARRTTLCR